MQSSNFGHMITSITEFDLRDKVLLVTASVEIMTLLPFP